MIEMYHAQHARVHPCAADESELFRLLAEGWVRTREELDVVRPPTVLIDDYDRRVEEMIQREEAEEKVALRSLRRVGGSAP